MKLKNKIALITGASRGIGKAIALSFAQHGADIALHCLVKTEEEETLVKEIQKYGRKVVCFEADISKISEVKDMVHAVKNEFTGIHILVNNAGIYKENSFFDSTEDSFDKIMDTNLKGAYFCSQFVAQIMLEQQDGNIINIASVAGLHPRKSSLEYGISKAGLVHLTKSLALVLAPHIRVNALAPSYTKTTLMAFMNDTKLIEEKIKMIPLGRLNEPEDIAKAALFLASEDSINITGEIMVIDGGRGANI